MSHPAKPAVQIHGSISEEQLQAVLTAEALTFLEELHLHFNERRAALLVARQTRQQQLAKGHKPDFLADTVHIRNGSWQVAPTPPDLQDRQVEITGPAEAKMMINALNSGAKAFMCDFEDSLSPTWPAILEGQRWVQQAVRKTLTFRNSEGKTYALQAKTATLLIRPRGWHLSEKHLSLHGQPLSASLVDFGLAFFHNAKELLQRGSGPYFYLPKLESHHEAKLWNDVFVFAQQRLGIPQGKIKVTVLIETILAAFEMEEILFELKDHISGLNAGRWDYIFSIIKKFSADASSLLPDRAQVTMTVPFMQAYSELLVKTCHKRGAHAMGGMAAFIPSRKDAEINKLAMSKVKEDKDREAKAGFDGTWVAHPDLVAVAAQSFQEILGSASHQKDKLRSDVQVSAAGLLDLRINNGRITVEGVRSNINVALQYIEYWLAGSGAVALHNLMEDAATAEIARAQLWQWLHHHGQLEDGRMFSQELYRSLRDQEIELIGREHVQHSIEILDGLVLNEHFAEFLTLPAYEALRP